MSGFDDRRKGQESKFAHDAELRFKAEARRNKLVGLWAAELLGKSGDEAAAYAMEVVSADFEEAGIEDVVRKVKAGAVAPAEPAEPAVATEFSGSASGQASAQASAPAGNAPE